MTPETLHIVLAFLIGYLFCVANVIATRGGKDE